MTTKFKKSFSPMLICWNDIKIHLGFEDSYFVPPLLIVGLTVKRPFIDDFPKHDCWEHVKCFIFIPKLWITMISNT